VNVGFSGFGGGCSGESLGLPCGGSLNDPLARKVTMAQQAIIAAIKGDWKTLLDIGLTPIEQQMWSQVLNPIMDADDPRQTWKQKNQDCLNKFNDAPEAKYFYNFLSPLSMIPGIGPEWKSSIAEDVLGSAAKYGVFKFFQAASTNWAGTGLGSMGGLVAETIHGGALFVTKTLVPAAVVGQLIGHSGCEISAYF
jgi:hypothetical protein